MSVPDFDGGFRTVFVRQDVEERWSLKRIVFRADRDLGGAEADVVAAVRAAWGLRLLRLCAVVLRPAQAARYGAEWASELHELRTEDGASGWECTRYVLRAAWSLSALAVECRLKPKRVRE